MIRPDPIRGEHAFFASLPTLLIDGKEILDNAGTENGPAECAICLEAVTKPEKFALLPCGHSYHQACVSEWRAGSKSMECPECRKLS